MWDGYDSIACVVGADLAIRAAKGASCRTEFTVLPDERFVEILEAWVDSPGPNH